MKDTKNRHSQTIQVGPYNITNSTGYELTVCYMQNITNAANLWQQQNPLLQYLPFFTMQLAVMTFTTRVLMLILKPLRQPRFISEFLAGIVIGPTALGRLRWLNHAVLSFQGNLLSETYANFGLTYYMFLVGLEMDLSALKHIGTRSISIAMAGILVPFAVGAGLHFVPVRYLEGFDRESRFMGAIFWAITLSITSFPDLARILSDVKLLHTELGRLALTTSLISDISAWILLIAAIIFFDREKFYMAAIPTLCFVLICWFLLRPGIAWILKRSRNKGDNHCGDTHITIILTAVAVCGCITDACGSHSLIGGFMLGLIIPHGEFAFEIMERVEEFVQLIMMPSFFLLNGLRTNMYDLLNKTRWRNLLLITVSATSSKILATLLVCIFFGMSSRDGLSLGGLMNTKGVLALIVLNESRNLQATDTILMVVMEFTVLFMTAMVGPIFFLVNKNAKRSKRYKRRTIQRRNPETELRILTCLHSTRSLPGIINLLQVSHATRKSPLCVFVAHLVKLTGRASAMLIVHDIRRTSTRDNRSREKADSDQIIQAFEKFEKGNDAVAVHPLTAVSPYNTMHEDVFSLAEEKRVALILVPFHKQPSDGGIQGEGDNHSVREVNKNLLVNAPCSVGILVDHGLGSSTHSDAGKLNLRCAMLFVGGPDDREALSYAWRMTGKPGVILTVVRFLPGKEAEESDIFPENGDEDDDGNLTAIAEREFEKEIDDEFINEFRFKSMCDKSITYHEKLVNNGGEIVETIKLISNGFDFYVVGRGEGVKSPLTKGLSEWSESPELGTIGETLATSECTAHASVLVLQQSNVNRMKAGLKGRKGKFGRKKWASPVLNPDYKVFVSHTRLD